MMIDKHKIVNQTKQMCTNYAKQITAFTLYHCPKIPGLFQDPQPIFPGHICNTEMQISMVNSSC